VITWTGGRLVGTAHVNGIVRKARNSPCGSISWIVKVLPWAWMPVISWAWPLWYSVAPTMLERNWKAGDCMFGCSVRSNVCFMLCAVTTPVSGGEKA
jgi:hypothetical protein